VFLLETLDVKFSGLVGHLYADLIVSAVEVEDISAEQTSFRASEKLLSVLSRKSSEQFQQFLDALDHSGQQHVRNVITSPQGLLIKTTEHSHHVPERFQSLDRKPGTDFTHHSETLFVQLLLRNI